MVISTSSDRDLTASSRSDLSHRHVSNVSVIIPWHRPVGVMLNNTPLILDDHGGSPYGNTGNPFRKTMFRGSVLCCKFVSPDQGGLIADINDHHTRASADVAIFS
jgi:hypothetical protein